jgi:hypothetical protein
MMLNAETGFVMNAISGIIEIESVVAEENSS